MTSPPSISANTSFTSVPIAEVEDSLVTTPIGRQNSESSEFPFETNDFVFRIIPVNKPSGMLQAIDLLFSLANFFNCSEQSC